MSLPRGALEDDPRLPPISVAGRTLHSVKFTTEMFLNKTTALWGSSNSGKSLMADNITYCLRKRFPSVVGFIGSPNTKNGIRKHFPPGSYTTHLEFDNFNKIAMRQKDMMSVYEKTINIDFLRAMTDKYIVDTSYRQDLANITYKMNRTINDIKAQYAGQSGGTGKINKVKELTTQEVIMVLKKTLHRHRDNIIRQYGERLTEDEMLVLEYIYYVPNLLIEIDDMTSKIISISKRKKEGEAFQDVFTQGRWWGLTLLLLLHADNNIPPSIKKGMFINIFTEASQVIHFFESKGLSYSKDVKKEATDIANDLYKNWKSHYRCLVYIREDPVPFRYYIADEAISLSSFTMGSDNFKKLCTKLAKRGQVFGIDNNSSLSGFKKLMKSKYSSSKPRPQSIQNIRL